MDNKRKSKHSQKKLTSRGTWNSNLGDFQSLKSVNGESENINQNNIGKSTEPTHMGGAKIFNITELTNLIKGYLESNEQFNNIWLRGEISNFTEHRSGHMYFDLKDANAVISCVIFRSQNQHLKFKPEHGMKVIGLGSINVYAPHGKYQIIFTDLLPDGLGALHMAFLQLKDKLSKEGLFAFELKRPIPKLPKIIGVVTSPTGAAIRDIIHVATRRFPGINILLAPSKVQGEGAAAEIVHSIELLHRVPGVEVIIIGRGGGSLEDLWAFNEEIVARAIFKATIPIISAVGHETDFTISDFVSDLRAPTPSAAAEVAIPDKKELLNTIQNNIGQILQCIESKITNSRLYLTRLTESTVFTRPYDKINLQKQNLDNLISTFSTSILNYQKLKRSAFDNTYGRLLALNPKAILNRGYSITLKLPEERLIASVNLLSKKDQVKVIFSDGTVRCEVMEKDTGNSKDKDKNHNVKNYNKLKNKCNDR